MTTDLRSLLVRWKRSEFIDQHTYRNLLVTDGVLPRAYGLTKIHKQNYPIRIIVSCIKNPLYPLASFLHNLIHNSIPKHFSHICNSYHLVNELNGQLLQTGCELVSLDVVSLFTNVPIDLINDNIVRKWNFISGVTSMPMEEFIKAIQMIVNSTFFTFNNKIYKQVFGTPMGSPLSSVLANIVLQNIEEADLDRLPASLPFYYRYVDDILLASPPELFELILETFNSFHDRLKFTMEIREDGRI